MKKDTEQQIISDGITAAIKYHELRIAEHQSKLADLRGMINGRQAYTKESPVQPEAEAKPKRTVSAAGRKAIARAQKQRWANARAEQPAAAPEPAKPKRILSVQGRRNIQAALKKRWAEKNRKPKTMAAGG